MGRYRVEGGSRDQVLPARADLMQETPLGQDRRIAGLANDRGDQGTPSNCRPSTLQHRHVLCRWSRPRGCATWSTVMPPVAPRAPAASDLPEQGSGHPRYTDAATAPPRGPARLGQGPPPRSAAMVRNALGRLARRRRNPFHRDPEAQPCLRDTTQGDFFMIRSLAVVSALTLAFATGCGGSGTTKAGSRRDPGHRGRRRPLSGRPCGAAHAGGGTAHGLAKNGLVMTRTSSTANRPDVTRVTSQLGLLGLRAWVYGPCPSRSSCPYHF
jgi:hypothetical protein